MPEKQQTSTFYSQGPTALLARALSVAVFPRPAPPLSWRIWLTWTIVAVLMISAFDAPCCSALYPFHVFSARVDAPLCVTPKFAVREDRRLVVDASGAREQSQRRLHNGACTCHRRLTVLPAIAEIFRRLLLSAPLTLVRSFLAQFPPVLQAFSIRAPPPLPA
jgi:hypothetical protein